MKLMSEMHLRQPKFIYSACGPFAENKETIRKLIDRWEIQYIFIKTGQKNPTFSMIWLTEILRIYLEKQLLIKYYIIKFMIWLKIKTKMDIKVYLPQ